MCGETRTGGEGETQEGLRPCGLSRKRQLGKGLARALVTLEQKIDRCEPCESLYLPDKILDCDLPAYPWHISARCPTW